MLFRQATLKAIAAGTVTLAFRRWTRPTVRAGGTLKTPVGELRIVAVDRIEPDAIDEADARAAGFASLAELRRELAARAGELYRIRFGDLRPDPRAALRESALTDEDARELDRKLTRMDRAAGRAWTARALHAIAAHPTMRAADLSAHLGEDRLQFKRNVRKLKALGLTESLETGYRLSRRGQAWLRWSEDPRR